MKTTKYISIILLMLSISCSTDSDFDLVPIKSIPEISFDDAGDNSQTYNVGIQDTDDLNSDIITVGGTGILSENNNFIGVATADASDDGATAVFTFDLTTNSATAIDATLNLELAKRAKGSVTGTVSVTGYEDTPFSYASTSTENGGSAPAIDFEFASTISLVSGTPLTVTITLDQMLTQGNTTTPIFRLSKVIVEREISDPISPNNILFDEAGDNSQTFNVGIEDTDDLNSGIITVGGTGVLVENNNFIGVATADASDDGATAVFTFDLTTNSATAIDATLNLELAKRAKGSVTGTVSVTGYEDTPFSYASTSTENGGSAPAIDFEFASTISLVSGSPVTVTITLDQMLTEGNTTTPIFRLSKVTLEKDSSDPAQNTWLDADNSIINILLSTTCTDCSVSTVANPDASDAEATNVTKWSIGSTSGSGNKSLSFDIVEGQGVTLADYANLIVTVRMYWPSFNDINNFDGNKRVRLYLGDGNATQQIQGNFVESNEAQWHTMVFDFTGTPSGPDLTSDIINGEIRLVGNNFTNLDNGLEFYIDTITYVIN